jgi:putative ABC transport system permease protein
MEEARLMALLVMILRKMTKNKWLELSLLMGLTLSVALMSSIPIYTDAILQRMLMKDLEKLQLDTRQYPGTFWTSALLGDGELKPELTAETIHATDQFMENRALPAFTLPVQAYVVERATDKYNFIPVRSDVVNPNVNRVARVGAISELAANIKLKQGRLPANERVEGIYEVLVVEEALTKLNLELDQEFTIFSVKNFGKSPIIFKPVGVFEPKDYDSLYWLNKDLSYYGSTFFIDFQLFENEFTSSELMPVKLTSWFFAMDYYKLDMANVNKYIHTHEAVRTFMTERYKNFDIGAYAFDTIHKSFEREKKLRRMLWSLNVPVMIMLGFYLFMISNLIVDRQKTEIAILKSRGASAWQVLLIYVLEGALLGVAAMLTGPYLGLFFTKMLGASNGFLEFVQRSALNAQIDREAYVYALIAVAGSLIMTLIPAWIATGTTIVGHKQQIARSEGRSFWKKYFIDVIFLAVSLYGLKSFQIRMQDIATMGLDSADFQVDPLLFLVPTLFILGVGMISLRIYPFVIKSIYWIGRRWWSPSVFTTLIQIARSSHQYQFIMLFLVVTIATGLFSASAARTINTNAEDVIRYKNGADIVLQLRWKQSKPPTSDAPLADDASAADVKTKIQYEEPPFRMIQDLPGVAHAAKVFVKENAAISTGGTGPTIATAKLMGIDTDQFGRTSWLRNGLLDHHFYDYLNLIATDPRAVLISDTLAEQEQISVGDVIYIGWEGITAKEFVVYGIVDYFPTFNPHTAEDNSETAHSPLLVIGQLDTIQNQLALEPYEAWIKLEQGAARQKLYDAIRDQYIPLMGYTDTTDEIISVKNDPFHLAINGVMTLGFLVSVIICFFGFLLYWTLSLFRRVLQFGIYRAMGISFGQLVGMLIIEQLLISGAAIWIGVMIGNYASHIFIPFFQLTYNVVAQMPPFKVTFDPQDYIQLYTIISLMISAGLFILCYLLSRIKIHQAVKLGED